MALPDRYPIPSPEYFEGLSDQQLRNEVIGGMYMDGMATVTFAGGCTLLAADSLPSLVEGTLTGNPLKVGYSAISFAFSAAMICTGKFVMNRAGLRVKQARLQQVFRREPGFAREALE